MRLPFSGHEILEILCKTERQVAHDPQHPDHGTFWFVTADQFQKRGLESTEVIRKATDLIESGANEIALQKFGMAAGDLRRRSAKLAELRERLQRGAARTRRATLKKPQELIMAIGDVLVYPTSRGESFNPYFAPGDERYRWAPDAWGALLIINAGLAFGYLAWYTIMVAKYEFDDRPTMDTLMSSPWTLRASGTCPPSHFRRMALESLGRVIVSMEKLQSVVGGVGSGEYAAISNISLGNQTHVISKNPGSRRFVQPAMEREQSLELREFAAAE